VERFHAGTRREAGALRVAGGRVLTVCARGASVAQAAALAYADAAQLSFEGMQLRRDIAAKAPTR
jgi:phosphoribosylamine--glycine ligase